MTEPSSIIKRLDALPRKIGLPFRDLLSRGYIAEPILEIVLDAGDIAEDSSKLIGFAIGYLNLRQSGVPISDVIKMSKALGRKIRLDWSINRWKSEHDRLSRAESLTRLAEENVAYDLSKFDAAITTPFPGYLIRTSRRLGMEGLRQRHCVASYHQQLLRNYCALASVFVDRKRWTVQLQLTDRPDSPLRISQIRSRLNVTPGTTERNAIHALFGVESPDATNRSGTTTPARPGRETSHMDNLRRVLTVLRENHVTRVIVSFDGSGDDGSIDSTTYEPDGFQAANIAVTLIKANYQLENDEWITTFEESEANLEQAIEDIVYDYLGTTNVDWVNGDGGFGECIISVDRGSVCLDVNSRFTDSTCEYSAELDIETGDEI